MIQFDIATQRKRMGISRSELARMLGVDRKTIYRWEKGENTPPDYVVEKVKTILLFSLDKSL